MKDIFINLYTGTCTWSQPCAHAQKLCPGLYTLPECWQSSLLYITCTQDLLSTKELKVDPQTKRPNPLYKLNQLHCLFIIPTWHFNMYMYKGVRHLDHTKGK